MIPLTLEQIANALGATIASPGKLDTIIRQVATDSRAIPVGSLFIALKGDRFDAHEFLPQVAKAGAAGILADQPDRARNLDIPCLLVRNTRLSLGELGHYARRQFTNTRTIAIGGSNGKTTTKHLVGSVLASSLKGTQSPKSFNNEIGVPLTILGVSPEDDYVVLELGTNHPGELSPLSKMAEPQIAVITSIGPEHLEGFGNLDGVRCEEARLLDGLVSDGLLIVNGDDAPLLEMVNGKAKRTITFGFAPHNDLCITDVHCSLDGIRFYVRGFDAPFTLPIPGRHNASNALAAIAIGREFGLSDSTIRQALANCSRPEMRMQIVSLGRYTILNDAYNANPASMKAALETIGGADLPGRRLAVLGEMRELGSSSAALHREIGKLAAQAKLDALVCVGQATRDMAAAAVEGGMTKLQVHFAENANQAASVVLNLLRDQDTLLLKGSRGVRLEIVAEEVAKAAGVELSISH